MDQQPKKDVRILALRRFGLAITILNLLGHSIFGFEQSWAQPLVTLAVTYSLDALLEWIDARLHDRRPAFIGGLQTVVDFFLPAHITGLAIAMLVYPGDRYLPLIFGGVIAIGSKAIFRTRVKNTSRHFLNPSNFGITATILLFPWISIAPPYHFTEHLTGVFDLLLPLLIICTGSLLNTKLTKRMPLILAWVTAFAAQAIIRTTLLGTSTAAALMPMTGVAFILFTFYMISDPGTTPSAPRDQIMFAVAVAAVYSLLIAFHLVYDIFIALTIVCFARGIRLWILNFLADRRAAATQTVPAINASRAEI